MPKTHARAKKGLPPLRRNKEASPPSSRDTRKKAAHASPGRHSGTRVDAPKAGQGHVRLETSEREGLLTVNPRGFGFVGTGAEEADIFVGGDSLGGAMHGDRVLVRIIRRTARGTEGAVEKVLERSMTRVGGVLRRRGRSAWVEPDDPRMRGPITLESAVDQMGPEGNSGNDGDAVVVRIVRYPDLPDELPLGKLEAVLGRPGNIRVETHKILIVGGIDELHSADAVGEAEAYGETVPLEMLEGREDLTHLPLPTIDPEDARDHDDAVWVERSSRGGYTAWIAIADVSAYVRPGTAIDAEAKMRGCSIYLPDRAIPMLPRALSSNLCSLLPDVIRLCLCAEIELDSKGAVTRMRVIRGFMKSQAKLTYSGVARALGLTTKALYEPKAEALRDGLAVAYELSRKLRGRRLKRGALDFDLPEAKITLDPTSGEPIGISKRAQDSGMKQGYQLIEELMLLANESIAGWLFSSQIPAIYRIHLPPDATKLERFAKLCETLGLDFDPESVSDPKGMSELLKSHADHPSATVLNMLLLRSLKQATYDVDNLGHFGLAAKSYLHFTSPIRRYPDLVVHRIVHSVLLNDKAHKSGKTLETLRDAASTASLAERRVMEIEREVVNLYRAMYMRNKIGERFVGNVTGVTGSGIYVVLDEPFVDVFIRTDDLGPGNFEVDEEAMRLVASKTGDAIGLGDSVELEIIDVSVTRRTVYGKRLGGGSMAGESRDGGKSGKQKEKKGKSERGKKSTDRNAPKSEKGGKKRQKERPKDEKGKKGKKGKKRRG